MYDTNIKYQSIKNLAVFFLIGYNIALFLDNNER